MPGLVTHRLQGVSPPPCRRQERRISVQALIVYHSKTGHTKQAAEDVARGLEGEGVGCVLKPAGEPGTDLVRGLDIDDFDIVLAGSPTYGNRLYRLPARPVERFMNSLSPGGLKGKTCGAFTVNAGRGGGALVGAMEGLLKKLGGKVVSGGPVVKAGAPLSLYKGPDASVEDVRKCEEFGKKVALAARG